MPSAPGLQTGRSLAIIVPSYLVRRCDLVHILRSRLREAFLEIEKPVPLEILMNIHGIGGPAPADFDSVDFYRLPKPEDQPGIVLAG